MQYHLHEGVDSYIDIVSSAAVSVAPHYVGTGLWSRRARGDYARDEVVVGLDHRTCSTNEIRSLKVVAEDRVQDLSFRAEDRVIVCMSDVDSFVVT